MWDIKPKCSTECNCLQAQAIEENPILPTEQIEECMRQAGAVTASNPGEPTPGTSSDKSGERVTELDLEKDASTAMAIDNQVQYVFFT